jgi:hypothetical protein
VPKTAGSAMEQEDFLGSAGHKWAMDFLQIPAVNAIWFKLFKFAFVRNPWDRFVSIYFRWPQTMHRPEYFHDFVMGKFRDTGFNIPRMKRNRWSLHHHFTPQHYFICHENGDILMDFVGCYENLEKDWDYVCERVGVPWRELPVVNRGEHLPYQEYYDDDTRDVIAEMYARDIELFEYEF